MSRDPPKATQLMRGPAGPGVQGSSLLAETTAHALPPSFEPSGCSPLSEPQFSHLNWVLHSPASTGISFPASSWEGRRVGGFQP